MIRMDLSLFKTVHSVKTTDLILLENYQCINNYVDLGGMHLFSVLEILSVLSKLFSIIHDSEYSGGISYAMHVLPKSHSRA